MLRNKADRATRALLREISRDNVDLFSSFESTKSVPTRASSADSTVVGVSDYSQIFKDGSEFQLFACYFRKSR